MNRKIWAKGIEMSFHGKRVLEQLDVEIGSGEIFGLLGPSGAGKTTFIKILTGQLTQSGGVAELLGQDTRKLSSAVYCNIGMVLDNSGLYDRLSCYDNLLLFAEIYRIPKTKITQVLKRVGLEDAKKKTVSKLSKGMRQRLIFARAILQEPEILFLDEPTSGLDPQTAAGIHQLILEEKAKGTTIFLTTHNMEEATKLCDYVGLLHQGVLVEYGVPGEVCRKYNTQNQLQVLLRNGEVQVLPNDASSVECLCQYLLGNEIESIHSTEPNLETVFMQLTGRGLD